MTDTKVVLFDKDSVKKHLDEIIEYQDYFKGKPNHNPFLWIKANVTPLLERLNNGETSPLLQTEILSLKKVPPIINSNIPNVEPPKK